MMQPTHEFISLGKVLWVIASVLIVGSVLCTIIFLPFFFVTMKLADENRVIELALFLGVNLYLFVRFTGDNRPNIYMLAFTAWLPIAVVFAVLIGLIQAGVQKVKSMNFHMRWAWAAALIALFVALFTQVPIMALFFVSAGTEQMYKGLTDMQIEILRGKLHDPQTN